MHAARSTNFLPKCVLRDSLRELVLDDGGRLRWGRLQNLVEEGSKSQDYDPQQLWLLARWLLGEQGATVRKPLMEELVRLIDAAVAGASPPLFCARSPHKPQQKNLHRFSNC